MTVIVNYGLGNLFSLSASLKKIGEECAVSSDHSVISAADRIILPGVGAFGDAAESLAAGGHDRLLRSLAHAGKPLLGVCLGMQLLFERSHEYGVHSGLGLIKGEVRSLRDALTAHGFSYKIPHMGWNSLDILKPDCPVLANTKAGDQMYFVHSFYAVNCDEETAASAEYGINVPAVVCSSDKALSVYGCQFHPEKSGDVGLRILKAFCAC